jgi:hypothetical protein
MGCLHNFIRPFGRLLNIKDMFKEMFDAFHQGRLYIERLNHGVITLIPKVLDGDVIRNFRPICLLNVSYKILNKILANRSGLVIYKIIADWGA